MLDAKVQPYINPFLVAAARWLHKYGIRADYLTWIGLAFSAIAGICLIYQIFPLALLFVLANRACDGLDGQLARLESKSGTDAGAYLDIVFDFIAYAGLPFCMAAGLDTKTAWAATAFLMLGIVFSGTTFLAYAIIAAKRREPSKKGFYYVSGLMEGTETVIFLITICLLPFAYPILASIFGILCIITGMGRIGRALGDYT
ncbi:MAG: CDP-alcohol phosphatidyltransferase family protein [Alphaproteobacteria bacterium]|nr:CDP-alcohol phosphatidyltransferase family protein [Alphaproteobacteria bacterium]